MKKGRPKENRKRLTVHVLKETKAKIRQRLDRSNQAINTHGKVIDKAFENC